MIFFDFNKFRKKKQFQKAIVQMFQRAVHHRFRKLQPEIGKCVYRKVCPRLLIVVDREILREKVQMNMEIQLCIISLMKPYPLPMIYNEEYELSMTTEAQALEGIEAPFKELKVNLKC